jgi:hypothetical protein
MGIRMGILHQGTNRRNFLDAPPVPGKDTWMNIYRNDQKIGYAHRVLKKSDAGYRIQDDAHLRLNVMGMVQDMNMQTIGDLNADFSLSSFSFDLASGLFDFSVTGEVKNNTLHVFMDGRETKYPLNEPLHLASGIIDAAGAKALTIGEKTAFYVFDPASLGRKPVDITFFGYETLTLAGKSIQARKYILDFMGLRQNAWVSENGEVVREEGLMGIYMEKADAKEALSGINSSDATDLTESISIKSNMNIPNQSDLTHLTMNFSGPTQRFFINGDRQTFQNGLLTIVKETLESSTIPSLKILSSGNERFLKSSSVIQSNHPKIKKIIADIISDEDSPLDRITAIMTWISQNILKRPVLSIPNALETLENRMGDCNEHAALFAAMARAAGIPTQIEVGLVHMEGRFYYHAWNVVYLGRWVTVDALMAQFPADVTHIRLIRGDQAEQLDLVYAIDRIQIHIEASTDD